MGGMVVFWFVSVDDHHLPVVLLSLGLQQDPELPPDPELPLAPAPSVGGTLDGGLLPDGFSSFAPVAASC